VSFGSAMLVRRFSQNMDAEARIGLNLPQPNDWPGFNLVMFWSILSRLSRDFPTF
jgi:hypothetical protein